MDSKELYELLGIDVNYDGDDFDNVVARAFARKITENAELRDSGEITKEEFYRRYDQLEQAKKSLIDNHAKAKATGVATAVVSKPASPSGVGIDADAGDDYDDDYEDDLIDEQTGAKKAEKTKAVHSNGKGAKIAAAVLVVAAIGIAGIVGYHLGLGKTANTNDLNNKVGIETSSGVLVDETTTETEEYVAPELKEYGNVQDEALITERATVLVDELIKANVINPTTGVAYTVDEIVQLIQYANGVYTPATVEEIDVLHLNLLNLFISPLNTDPYLYHVVYASGNDDFKDVAAEAIKDVKEIDFASAFAEYGENGVYPLTLWMQQKREAIYTTMDREEINAIYCEVGQVMADLMKGNGCTITLIENGEEVTYTFTSEQVLANHASAMLLTIDAQLIFANHYELRDENNKVVDSVQDVWLVYNKFNSSEEPDEVSLEEIEAWINNGCDYEWGIDEVLINGQTFGQRIQGDMEGMALNNYAMTHGSQSMGK